jgi:hypothetical protein
MDFLANLDHLELLRLRQQNPHLQDLLAPYEHRAWAREYVAENPVTGLLGASALIPLYQMYKLTGQSGARSAPSIEQVIQGYKGVGEGLLSRFK